MNRQELVEKIAAAEELPKAKAARVLQTVLDAVVETVKADEKLTLVGAQVDCRMKTSLPRTCS